MVIPNFAIGAVLMMKFAAMASKYYDHAEIIELHHNRKADAPSGTAIKTAELMSEALKQAGKSSFVGSEVPETELFNGARGASVGDGAVHIHSVRLPGYVAHQEVLLSGPGEVLTLRHDSMDRKSFMPGVILAVKAVMNRPGLTYGLEHILE
jgi:4-hydroxy-tetrahydrodipicolinate reductase